MRAAILLTVFLASLAGALPARAAEPLRIGVSLGLTGKYKELAEMHERAYLLWENEVNVRGGLLGRPVVMVVRDDESDPAKAAAIYRDLVTGHKVDLVFGPYSSEITKAIAPIVEKHGYPTLLSGACADELWEQGYSHVFGLLPPCSRYTYPILELALVSGLKRFAVLYADDPFSRGVAAGARKKGLSLGLDLVLELGFEKGTTDLTEQARGARNSGAGLVVVAGHFNEAVNVRRALAAVRWMPRAYFATIGPALPEWEKEMGALAGGAFATSIWEPGISARSRSFAAAFRKRYGVDPSYQAATAYCAGQILAAAVQRANGLNRTRIRDSLSGLDTYCVTGRYRVDGTGRQTKELPLVIQWQGGNKEIVWPKVFRTAQPIFGPK